MRTSTFLRLSYLAVLCALLLPYARAQEQELVLVVSLSFAMTLRPTVSELLPESLRLLQETINTELQLAQERERTSGDSTRIDYVTNKTRVVFRNADFHAGNSTTTIRFFALATVQTVSVPAGTSFRDFRLRSAETRQDGINNLVQDIFNSTRLVDVLYVAVETADDSSETGRSELSVAASLQLLAIEAISAYPVSDAPAELPPDLVGSEAVQSENRLPTVDVVLICISVLIFAFMVMLVVRFRRDQDDTTEVGPSPSSPNDNLTATPTTANSHHNEKPDVHRPETSRTGRLSLYRDMGEFKAGDSASSSIASIVFHDYGPPRKPPPDCQIFVRDIQDVDLPVTAPASNHFVYASSDEEDASNEDSKDGDSTGDTPEDGPMMSDEHPSLSLALEHEKQYDSSCQSTSETTGWSTGTDTSSLLSNPPSHDDTGKQHDDANPDSFSPLLNLGELVPSSFSVLVDSLLMSDPQGLLLSTEAKDAKICSDDLSVPETFTIEVFRDDISSSTTSKGGNVFRELSRSISGGSDDVFKVDVASTAKESAARTAISEWMKSICVVRSTSASSDSKTSINTSLSSVTTPSAESPGPRLSKDDAEGAGLVAA
jgi:hypothetical protein